MLLTRPGRRRVLAELVGDESSFLSRTFGHEPWLRNEPLAAPPAFGLADVDGLVASALLRRPFFRLVRDGTTLPAGDYTRSLTLSGARIDGVVEPGRVRALMAEGATLVLESAHRYVPSLARWSADLALDLQLPVQANVYVTPPAGAGFAAHVDSHDVFVVHLHGTKRWTIRARSDRLPRPVAGDRARLSDDDTVATDDLATWEMRPGSVAYLPRGYPHQAAAGDDGFSLHVTFGVLAPTWADMAAAVAAARDHWARDLVPPRAVERVGRDGDTGVGAGDTGAPGPLVIAPDELRAACARRLIAGLPTAGAPTSLAAMAPAAPTSGASGCLHLVVDAVLLERSTVGDGVTAVLPDRELDFPAKSAVAAERLLRRAAGPAGVDRAELVGLEAELADGLVAAGVLGSSPREMA